MTAEEYASYLYKTAYAMTSSDYSEHQLTGLTNDAEEKDYWFELTEDESLMVIDVSSYSPKIYSEGCDEQDAGTVKILLFD